MSRQTAEQSDQGQDRGGESKLVPVGESIKYRRRAQQAETRVQELEQQLKDLQAQLESRTEQLGQAEAQRDEAAQALRTAENRLAAERLLAGAGVVDLETAGLLLAERIDLSAEIQPEQLSQSIEQLLIDKPILSRPSGPSLPSATASARPGPSSSLAQLSRAAERAIQTGDRKDVAEYLRLRRNTAISRS